MPELDGIGLRQARAADPAPMLALWNDWSTLMLDAVARRGGAVLRRGTWPSWRPLSTTSAAGQAALANGVGIARGEVVVATVTAAQRAAYACLEASVQRAEQLAPACLSGGQALLMGQPRWRRRAAPPTATRPASISP